MHPDQMAWIGGASDVSMKGKPPGLGGKETPGAMLKTHAGPLPDRRQRL